MKRALVTIGVVCGLVGLYLAYGVVVRPLVRLPERPEEVKTAAARPEADITRPVENVRVADQYLPDYKWAAASRYQLRTENAFIYANEWEPIGNRGEIRFKPFAMVYTTNRKGEPAAITMACESALIKFTSNFDTSTPNPGRVIAGALEGVVTIRGPQDLEIVGKNFHLSESAASMWSDHPVTFAFGPHRGSGLQLQAELIPSEFPVSNDRPAIVGIRSVRLRKNVDMTVVLKDKKKPLPVRVQTQGSFEYRVEEQQAVFEEDPALKDRVLAYRETGPKELDWIRCDRLSLFFEPKPLRGPAPPPKARSFGDEQYQRIDTDLRFYKLVADGRSVHVESQKFGMKADMTRLAYDMHDRRVTLSDPKVVKVRQKFNLLESPEIALQLGEGDGLQEVVCRGPGLIENRTAEGGEAVFAANWAGHLRKYADAALPLDILELAGQASFRQPARKTALGAETIRVWVDRMEGSGLRGDGAGAGPMDADVRPHRLLAEKKVALVSPQMEAEAESLEVKIAEHVPEHAPGESEQIDAAPAGGKPGERTGLDRAGGSPVKVKADAILVNLEAGATKDDQPSLVEVWTEGKVRLGQDRGAGKPPLEVTGEKLHLQNKGENRETVSVYGQPASIRDSGVRIAGPAVHLDRGENIAWVDGAGLLQLPVTKGLNGEVLDKAEPLDIHWQERMVFDGFKARFDGLVRVEYSMDAEGMHHHNRMQCHQMNVTLNRRVSFSAPPEKAGGGIELQTIGCTDGVEFESYARKDGLLQEVRRGSVWRMNVDQQTGKIDALGKGVLQIWQRGEGGVRLASAETSQANRPTTGDPAAWDYTHIHFSGTMTGNIHRRTTTFEDRVQIVHGPVGRAVDVLDPDHLPKDGGSLRCDLLQITQQQGAAGEKPWLEAFGSGNAVLEGEAFHARADEISFDQSKSLYVLRSTGNRSATFWRESTNGSKGGSMDARRMEFNPKTNQLKLLQATAGSAE